MEGQVYPLEELRQKLTDSNDLYIEFLRIEAMSAGLYALSANATDPQTPHNQDEIYYVIKGQATIEIAGTPHEVKPGSTIFVAQNVDHHFQDITEDLEVLVLFAPAETE
jgi:quercetin dioxygenase-like cupin family protein